MKTFLKITLFLIVIIAIGCEKEDSPPTAEELIVGIWVIDSSEILATVVPGDGSYLQFDSCALTCDGIDYKVSDTTKGTFIYSINEAATLLSITDNSSDGGSWTGEWDVLELTETDFRITTSTIFGSMKIEMSK